MNANRSSKLFCLAAAGTLLAFGSGALAQATAPAKPAAPGTAAQPTKPATPAQPVKTPAKHEAAKVGAKAPDFALKDTDGKEHTLASSAGKIVVLEWFNPECPYVQKHHVANKTLIELSKKYGAQGVQFFAINSNATGTQGSGVERNAKAKKDFTLDYPILLDESGATGMAYGAKNTPLMVVIGADGNIAYRGAIDDNDDATTPGKTNYVAKALDELIAKKPVTTAETKPYGCAVKYKNN